MVTGTHHSVTSYTNCPCFSLLNRITQHISKVQILLLSPTIRPLRNRKLVQAVSVSYKVKPFIISVLFTLRVAGNVYWGGRGGGGGGCRDCVGRCVVFNRKSSMQYFLTSRCD